MELENIKQLLTALVVFEAVKMGLLIIVGYCWLAWKDYCEIKKEK